MRYFARHHVKHLFNSILWNPSTYTRTMRWRMVKDNEKPTVTFCHVRCTTCVVFTGHPVSFILSVAIKIVWNTWLFGWEEKIKTCFFRFFCFRKGAEMHYTKSGEHMERVTATGIGNEPQLAPHVTPKLFRLAPLFLVPFVSVQCRAHSSTTSERLKNCEQAKTMWKNCPFRDSFWNSSVEEVFFLIPVRSRFQATSDVTKGDVRVCCVCCVSTELGREWIATVFCGFDRSSNCKTAAHAY